MPGLQNTSYIAHDLSLFLALSSQIYQDVWSHHFLASRGHVLPAGNTGEDCFNTHRYAQSMNLQFACAYCSFNAGRLSFVHPDGVHCDYHRAVVPEGEMPPHNTPREKELQEDLTSVDKNIYLIA